MLGIAKAYTTRVGSGPFPTEQDNEVGQKLGERGQEFGTVTGRKRRCGWFDAVLVRQAVAVSGITGIALTKLDVLDGFETVKICTGYKIDGEEVRLSPAARRRPGAGRAGLRGDQGLGRFDRGARSWADLPARAIKYVRRIEELIRCPVALVSPRPSATTRSSSATRSRANAALRSARRLSRLQFFHHDAHLSTRAFDGPLPIRSIIRTHGIAPRRSGALRRIPSATIPDPAAEAASSRA